MPRPTLLSSTLRRLTVAVSLLTSALFAFLTAVILAPSLPELGVVFFLPIFWLHCYFAGYVSYRPTEMGRVRDVVTTPKPVRNCTVCGDSDTRGVVREFSTQLVAAGVALTTTEHGKNEYCERCHAVEFSPTDRAARGASDATEREELNR
ncbi:hypothetical protein E6P09_06300 [Haloferax mediterranei ATCC 33500]|uniref:DUF8108 domain-containing protein n=1 Tax=Haloferax mediterranei (strain ATCC 33500 / DSM 1411 / JCM 8866 / NBRC 14739 / NCIMB 2177 / R-4) TaxID=523841 RepID=I3R2B4_HALMT|nr:hypothetical protein [Haloferax mediterranei]AFK18374.1 hypothetical protein HFX_0650 [Haloferax mediterranei ATCC 33500]AHZ22230.1 hypothetical protein BM92_05985 [Haloferax mediterranei ATCC 33500]EMA02351.1 hypothetical protein C439_07210 [Haloferax mediterranei ATCC 33500]MDX5988466.1 hypothetical protein [Haloferax mediterranei ATCC 33500]QCQ74885.1 hypothetical protein E6P09_06300 [Haloferax mediterranei ATCC 33500]